MLRLLARHPMFAWLLLYTAAMAAGACWGRLA